MIEAADIRQPETPASSEAKGCSLHPVVLRPVELSKTPIKAGQNSLRFMLQYLTSLLLCG